MPSSSRLADQELGVDVGGVHQVLARGQALAGQRLVDRGRAPRLVHGGEWSSSRA